MPVHIPTPPLLTQLPADDLGKAVEDGPFNWALVSCVPGDLKKDPGWQFLDDPMLIVISGE